MKLKKLATAATIALSTAFLSTSAGAQTVEEFYSDNNLTLMVSAAPGGGADLYARAFAPFLSKHLPGNPNVVIANVPGAGGLTAAAQLQNSAPRDGTAIAALQRNNLYLPLVSAEKLAFDPREVNWIGSLNKESYVLITWENAPVKTLDDLFSQPLTIGSTSFNNENRTFPAMINEYLGSKMDIIPGYKGNDEIALAMERGEVQGRAVTTTSLLGGNDASWLAEGKLNVIAQLAMRPSPAVKDVPMILDKVTDPKARSVFEFMFLPLDAGRPFAAPPEVPEDRLAALRAAFQAAAEDPGFIAEVAKQNATVEMIAGDEVHKILDELYATSPDVLDQVKGLLVSK